MFVFISNAISDVNDVEYNIKFEEEYEINMKSTLRIKSEYINQSNKKLAKVEKHKRSVLSKKEKTSKINVRKNVDTSGKITYVGVHNRRTDHIQFMREREKREPLDESFFSFAFQFFR